MKRKCFKMLSLFLVTVMFVSSFGQVPVAYAAPSDDVALEETEVEETTTQELVEDSGSVDTQEPTEESTEETTQAATEENTQEETSDTDSFSGVNSDDEANTEETTQETIKEPAAEETADDSEEEMEEPSIEEKEDQGKTVSSNAMLSTYITNKELLNMVATILNINANNLTVADLQSYTGDLVFDPTSEQVNAITDVKGLGVATSAKSIDISKFTKVTSISTEEFMDCTFTTFKMPTSITSIGEKAFYNCARMTSIYSGSTLNSLPDGLTNLKQHAFAECDSLTTIAIPKMTDESAVGAFQQCDKLVSVTFGPGVTKIAVAMFNSSGSASSGVKFTFSTGLDKILGEAFYGVKFPDGYTVDLSNCTKMTGIDASAFENALGLSKIILPQTISGMEIGSYAFANTTLSAIYPKGSSTTTAVILPNYVRTLGQGAFYNASKVTSVTLSSNLTVIEDYTFDQCTSLKTVTNAGNTSKVTLIGDCAFRNTAIQNTDFLKNMPLKQIGRQLHDSVADQYNTIERIPEGGIVTEAYDDFDVRDIANKTYNGYPVGSEVFTDCEALTSITLPATVEVIGNRAFYRHVDEYNPQETKSTVVKTLSWASSSAATAGKKRKIWGAAFSNLTALQTVELPQNIGESLEIGPEAFAKDSSLTVVGVSGTTNNTFPNTVSVYGTGAFKSCSSLKEVNIPAYNNAAPDLGGQVFEGCLSIEKATLPTQVTEIPIHFFGGCPLTSFNFDKMVNLVSIKQLAFVGNQFTTVDLSKCTKLQMLDAGCLAAVDAVRKDYMDGGDYSIEVNKTKLPMLQTVILPSNVNGGMHFDTALFYGQINFDTLYKYGSTASDKVVIPFYVLPDENGEQEATFGGTNVSQVIWEADTVAGAEKNRWKDIGPGMFVGCGNITDAKNVLPKYVERIYSGAFALSGVRTVDLSGFTNLAEIGYGDRYLGDIGYGAFVQCRYLTIVKLPSSVASAEGIKIGQETFKESGLTSIDLGATTELRDQSFAKCTGLQTIDLKNVKRINSATFSECTSLKTVNFGKIEEIGNNAFEKCSVLSLNSTPLPDSLKTIGMSAFFEATSLGKVVLGSGITKIDGYAFSSSGLTSIDFTKAKSLTEIGSNAFESTKLTQFSISGVPVKEIPYRMLYNCASLTAASFGQEIEYISNDAIAGCPKFKTFEFYTTTTVDEDVFLSMGETQYTGQNNGGTSESQVTITVNAKVPEEIMIPIDRELNFPYYVNKKGTSNIKYICIYDANNRNDMTVEDQLFVRAKTNDGYFKVQNSNVQNSTYRVSSAYHEDLNTALTVEKNGKEVDVIQVKGLKASSNRDLRFAIYADIKFNCYDENIQIKSAPFTAEYKVKIQDPLTTVVLYDDYEQSVRIPTKSHIQANTYSYAKQVYYNLQDLIPNDAEQKDYNITVKSSNPNVLSVSTNSYADSATASCVTEATDSSGYTWDYYKTFYLIPKGVGTATITLYPNVYDEAEREKHKTTYTFTVNADIQTLTLSPPEQYINQAHPGDAFNVFQEYTTYLGQTCTRATIANFDKYTNTKVVFSSSDPSFVSVDQRGNVKVLKAVADTTSVTISAKYKIGDYETESSTTLYVCFPDVSVDEKVSDKSTNAKVKVTYSSKKDLEGEVTYLGPVDKKKKTVTIPDYVVIKGVKYKVTAIADKAFKNNKKVQTVKIGKYVKVIGVEAFSGCKALKKVTIGNGVETISEKAFYKCQKLATVTISSKSKLQTIGASAFHTCKKLKKIYLPKTFTTLDTKAFYNCKVLKTITLKSNKLSYVGDNALRGIYKKAVIKVPKKKLSYYKSLFKGKGQKSSVKVKK